MNATASPETHRPSLSLELFPPRPGPSSSQTWGALNRLLGLCPDFVSVTYRPSFVTSSAVTSGAPSAAVPTPASTASPAAAPAEGSAGAADPGPAPASSTVPAPASSTGSAPASDGAATVPAPASDGAAAQVPEQSAKPAGRRVRVTAERDPAVRNPAEDVIARVLAGSQVPLMAHLTCIGYRKRDVVEIVGRFLRMGVRRFLALRGDPPRGVAPEEVGGELRRAEDLVRVIREVEAEFFDDGERHLQIAVAAYPAAIDHGLGVEILAAKQAAGADLAITQVFYDAEDYLALTRACLYSGVSLPILPGIIPLTDLRRLTRLEPLTGVRVPERLHDALRDHGRGGAMGTFTRGIDATLRLATEVLDGGAPGLHLYTFNRTRPALDVVSQLRLGGILAGQSPDLAVQQEVRQAFLNAIPGGGRRMHEAVAVPSRTATAAH